MVQPEIYAAPVVAPGGIALKPAPSTRELQFRFTGEAGEYFRIWIVNVLLTILTLGVYSAWAKVRTRQYFYRNTHVEGSSFEYLADPIRILKGRLLIGAVLAVLGATQYYSATAYGIALACVLLATPWVVVKALSFNARNSAYRNVRFAFQGTVGESYGVYLTCALVYVLTLGLGTPYVNFKQHQFAAGRHLYGLERFEFNKRPGQYFRLFAHAFMAIFGMGVVAAVLVYALVGSGAHGSRPDMSSMVFMMAIIYSALLIPAAMLRAGTTNLLFDELKIGAHQLRCNQRTLEVLGLYISNIIAVVLSLGLAIPWAKIRMARYRAQRMQLVAVGSLEVTALPGAADPGSYGEAAADLGDFGIDFS